MQIFCWINFEVWATTCFKTLKQRFLQMPFKVQISKNCNYYANGFCVSVCTCKTEHLGNDNVPAYFVHTHCCFVWWAFARNNNNNCSFIFASLCLVSTARSNYKSAAKFSNTATHNCHSQMSTLASITWTTALFSGIWQIVDVNFIAIYLRRYIV